MHDDSSPTARSLLALEHIQANSGITADALAARLGVSARAARRYVAILREADVPVESTRGKYGGYRVGRGLRVPPLMFTPTEALALVMAVLEGRGTSAPEDPVTTALSKIIRVLPEPVAGPAVAVRTVKTRDPQGDPDAPSPETTAQLAQASAEGRRVHLRYRLGPGNTRPDSEMDVDPWAVVVRRGRWYLLCWSHSRDAVRVLRIDRVTRVDVTADTFTPPADLDPVRALEEHLSQGWTHEIRIEIEAPESAVACWIPRTLGRLEAITPQRTLLLASTDDPEWYAQQLALLRSPFRIVDSPELTLAVKRLAANLTDAAS